MMQKALSATKKELTRNWVLYLMLLPVAAYYIIFCYVPMYGALIAFQKYSPGVGILDGEWVGFQHFIDFFNGVYFGRLLRNTLTINFYLLIFGFPAPLLFALLINELRSVRFKRVVQTVSYLPHFVSVMVICGIVVDFTMTNGVINQIISAFGGTRGNLLMRPELFRPIYVVVDIWQEMGWNTIIYMAAFSAINVELYEAARIDGCNRLRQMIHITLPCISPTIIILLIMKIGQMMTVNYEKIILLYNPLTYETGDVISSFVYRKGLLEAQYDFSTAVGLFNSAVNILLLTAANFLSRKFTETSLW